MGKVPELAGGHLIGPGWSDCLWILSGMGAGLLQFHLHFGFARFVGELAGFNFFGGRRTTLSPAVF